MPTAQIWPPPNPGTTSGGPALTIDTSLLTAATLVQQSGGNVNVTPNVQVCSGATDAVTFANPINIARFTSTGPDAATLATPVAGDAGKILILINDNTTQNVVTTSANVIVNGTASPGDTLTAPAHAGAVTVLIASNLKWAMLVNGTGGWVLSEV